MILDVNPIKVIYQLFDTLYSFANIGYQFLTREITFDISGVPNFLIDWMQLPSDVITFNLLTVLGTSVLPILLLLYLIKQFIPIA